MGISIFPSRGNGYTLQRVITTTGEYDLGAPTDCFILMSGGGGGGGGESAGSGFGAGGGGGAGAVGFPMLLNQFHATIGVGGAGGSSTGGTGGDSALTIGSGDTGTAQNNQTPNRLSKQLVAMGGGGGARSSAGAGTIAATISGITNRQTAWNMGSSGSSGSPRQGQSQTQSTSLYRTHASLTTIPLTYGFIHNNSGGSFTAGTPGIVSGASFRPFISINAAIPSSAFSPTQSTYTNQQTTFTHSDSNNTTGAAPGGLGGWDAGASAGWNGASGFLTGGGGGGGYSNVRASAAGGATGLYNSGLGNASGGGGGGGAGIYGAGANGTFTSASAGGNGGAGGFGGGGGGGAGGGTGSATTGGNGGDGVLLIFF